MAAAPDKRTQRSSRTMPVLASAVQSGRAWRGLQSGMKPHRNRALVGGAGVAQG
jgi:hypothetical protein